MDSSVDTLVYQMEDDDASVKLDAIRKLREVAVQLNRPPDDATSFPVRNARRFLNCVRRRLNDTNSRVVLEAQLLVCDLIPVIGSDNEMHLYQIVLPQLLQMLPHDQDWEDPTAFPSTALHVLWAYAQHGKDIRPVMDLLINQGLNHNDGAVRESAILAMKQLLVLHRAGSPLHAVDYGMLVEVLIPSMEDDEESTVVAAEEALGWIQGQIGAKAFAKLTQQLNGRDRAILLEHKDFIAKFVPDILPSSSDSQLQFGLVPKWIVDTLTSTSASLPTKLSAMPMLHQLLRQTQLLTCQWYDCLDFLLSLSTNDQYEGLLQSTLDCLLVVVRTVGSHVQEHDARIFSVVVELMATLSPTPSTLLELLQLLFNHDHNVYLKLTPTFHHPSSRVREQACMVLMMALLSHPDSVLPTSSIAQHVGRLLCDPSVRVRHLALESCAVLKHTCQLDIESLLQSSQDDLNDTIDWQLLRRRLSQVFVPVLTSNGSLLLDPSEEPMHRTHELKTHLWLPKDEPSNNPHIASPALSSHDIARNLTMLKQRSLAKKKQTDVRKASTPVEMGSYSPTTGEREHQICAPPRDSTTRNERDSILKPHASEANMLMPTSVKPLLPDDRPIKPMLQGQLDQFQAKIPVNIQPRVQQPKFKANIARDSEGDLDDPEPSPEDKSRTQKVMTLATRKRLEAKQAKADSTIDVKNTTPPNVVKTGDELRAALRAGKQEYVSTADLSRYPLNGSAKATLAKCTQALNATDWEQNFEGLTDLRRIAVHAPDVLASQLPQIGSVVAKHINNLRSSVAKNAMLTVETLCICLARRMDSEIDEIVPLLLKRASDTNAFLSDGAAQTFDAIAEHCTAGKLLSIIIPHASAKATMIRKQVATVLGKILTLEANASRLENIRDLDRVLTVLCTLVADSNNEVRDAAKPTLALLKSRQLVETARLKRAVPSATLSRVDQVLQSSTPSVDSLLAVKQEKPKPNTKSTTGVNSGVFDSIMSLQAELESNNWKDRCQALETLRQFLEDNGPALVQSGKLIGLFDTLNKRLEDGNAKVNMLALEVLNHVIPVLADGLDAVLSNLTPVLARNLAANNQKVVALAEKALDLLCDHVEGKLLYPPFATLTRTANARIKPTMIGKLQQLIVRAGANQSVITRYVLPLAFELMKESKTDIKDATQNLLRALYASLGPAMFDSAYKLPKTQQDRLRKVLGVCIAI
ncbi:hypothetical protein LEN26_011639 [Aphanomyces euteiches]|nr:hypothetical protein AeMF1_021676 [Aphanomyces euteiches]KAH9119448.1 hypothetical protein LEN26_011639 [Aphanomyces euteiches]KAH9185611.1 hypothetical protein AeNC1_012414 [Aphanomyces euteiches]